MTARNFAARSRLMCGTALILLSAVPALAAEEEAGVLSLDPILVQKRDPLGGAADRATAVYVADAEIERAAMGDLRDLFAGIASVSVGGAIPVAQKIFVNGVDMLNLAIQVDGVSQNNRVFHHASANAFDPGMMKFVRVDPGAAPADAGPYALAGSVVMETVDAGDLLDGGQAFGGRARLSYSGNGQTAGGSLALASRSNGFEFLAYGRRMTGDDYKDGGGNTVTGTAADLTTGLMKFAYEGLEGHRVEFSAQQMDDKSDRNFRANFGPSGAGTVVYDTSRKVASLRYENTNGFGMWDPMAMIGFSETRIAAPLYGPSFGTSKTVNARLQNTFHLPAAGTITAGIDFLKKNSHFTDGGATPEGEEKSDTIGLFAQARLEPARRLKLSAGLRADWQDFTGEDFAQTGTPYTDDPFGFSGNLSLVYDVTDELSLRAAYSNVFGGIMLEDNYHFWRSYDYSALEPSRAQNIVLGADWQSGGWDIGGEVFQTQIDDTRTFAGAAVTTYDFESRGYNLAATYGWDSGFARFTFSDSESTVDGDAASSYYVLDSGAPLGKVLSLQVQQQLRQLNMVAGAHVEAALSYSHGATDDPSVQALPGYEVLNLFAEYRPPSYSNVTIRASLDNAFDRTFSDRATYGGDYDGFSTLNEPGRTFRLEASVTF